MPTELKTPKEFDKLPPDTQKQIDQQAKDSVESYKYYFKLDEKERKTHK